MRLLYIKELFKRSQEFDVSSPCRPRLSSFTTLVCRLRSSQFLDGPKPRAQFLQVMDQITEEVTALFRAAVTGVTLTWEPAGNKVLDPLEDVLPEPFDGVEGDAQFLVRLLIAEAA